MPFEVFRRHQKKLLAVFAIFAMFAFVVSDSLPRLLSGNSTGPGDDLVVATLYDKTVRRSDLRDVGARRMYANQFMNSLVYFLTGRPPAGPFFGEITDRALVDALILDHEADDLGLPSGPDFGRRWLTEQTRSGGRPMTREVFQLAMTPLADQLTGEQVLECIAAEARRLQVRILHSSPIVTPLDVFEAYRDQNERIAVRAAAFPAERYLDKVGEPSSEQLQAYYEKHKDELPDPERDTPGFKVPRKVKVEYLAIDGARLAREIREKLTDEELRTYYENRKAEKEFVVPSDFPDDIFADDPDATLTPPLSLPFDQVRDQLANALAESRTLEQIEDTFSRARDEAFYPIVDEYQKQVDEAGGGRRGSTSVPPPAPNDLGPIAKREGLEREVTPSLTREAAADYGRIGAAESGLRRLAGTRTFADEAFDPRLGLFEPFDLTTPDGRRFLARKVEDTAPRVPTLDEARAEVAAAWKLEQARDLAKKAAEEYAEGLRKQGGKLTDEIVEGRPVIITSAVSRMQPGSFQIDPFPQMGPPTPTLLPEFASPGDELRSALFGLREGEVAVAPNAPRNTYYVLALEEREPASFDRLFGPGSTYSIHQREAISEAATARETSWMNRLRAEAGLEATWIPPDERERLESGAAS